jgi:hypothetical protein
MLVVTIDRLIAGCSESPATLRRQDAGKSFEEQEHMSAALHSVYWDKRSALKTRASGSRPKG